MSGRVRWMPGSAFGRGARWLRVGLTWPGTVFPLSGGRWGAWLHGVGAIPSQRRRSDAKRWLLARAAGLAEVPRGPKLRRGVRRIPRGGALLYIGGRLVAVAEHATIETETDERNRRRR